MLTPDNRLHLGQLRKQMLREGIGRRLLLVDTRPANLCGGSSRVLALHHMLGQGVRRNVLFALMRPGAFAPGNLITAWHYHFRIPGSR